MPFRSNLRPRTMNAIDWLLSVLHRSRLPKDVSTEEMHHRLGELRLMSAEITDYIMKCPGVKCAYKTLVPRGEQSFDLPHICPLCSTPLISMTWKEAARHAFNTAQNLEKAYTGRLQEMVARLDDTLFLGACEQEELEQLRDVATGPLGWLRCAMVRELENNSHKGNWDEWEPDAGRLVKEIEKHSTRLLDAVSRNNRYAVDEHAADIANFALKAAQLFGTAPAS